MRKMFRLAACLLLLYTSTVCFAQNNNVKESGYGMVKTNMNMAYDHGWGVLEDNFAARVSYELLRNSHFSLTANARYSSTEVKFGTDDLSGGFDPEAIHLNGVHLHTQIGATSTLKTKLLGRPFMAMAMVNSEWGVTGFDRISAIAMGLFMLKSTRNTQFGIGPLVMVNTNSTLPAFLVFMYRHRFNPQWVVSLYGGIFGLEYTPSENDLICLGADVDVKAFYFRPDDEALPEKCRFTSTTFRPMLKYKHRLAENLYAELMGGMGLKMSSRVNGVTGGKEWIDCKQKAAPFVQAAVSYSL